ADALAVHLNPLQEAVQPEGDTSLSGSLALLKKLCSELSLPVIAKETGAGISAETALALESAGVSMIDVSGLGGTSWGLVEAYRRNKPTVFGGWGIPTAQSVIEVHSSTSLPIIASGGIKNGLDAAKCLGLGASYAGSALRFLRVTSRAGAKGLVSEIEDWKNELKTAMFLSGSKNLAELSHARLVVSGATARAIKARGLCAKK
ncbi:MAG: alpha-hydroxy-acid oxidizing protein, partial [Candidatus Micrarchaeota archaeon]|nr:alpha-hydroxy-acid oxidizing protein [Candidatus Micrarchaeota archaeon]